MKNPLLNGLREVTTFLSKQGVKYAVIGGIANQIWGQARFTYDIDLKVLVPDTNYSAVREMLTQAFPTPGRPELPMNPLIVSVIIDGIIVDFLLTTPGYEEQLIIRAIQYSLDDLDIWVCTAEDLIIQKAIANRVKDWQDIAGIMEERFLQLEVSYLEEWLTLFAEALDNSEMLSQYHNIREHVSHLYES